jgi:hypothetical protein
MDYRFSVTEEDQPHYGGADITGRGGAPSPVPFLSDGPSS